MTSTPRLLLPLLEAAQAQKEITHNEALALLDHFVQPVIEAVPSAAPPASPVDGTSYIVGTSATGDWSGYDDHLAMRINAAWVFLAPFDGLTVWLKFYAKTVSYSAGSWVIGSVNASHFKVDGIQVLGAQQSAIAAPTGGSTTDTEARTAISAILSALEAHGLIAT
ncbi:MAG: DUF2793 domain-containing protein [Pseudomonadota bacterium]